MEQPLFSTSYAGSRVTIFEDRLEWKMLLKKQIIPLDQIASVDSTIPLYAGVTIETTGGKKFKIPVMFTKKKELSEAIFRAKQSKPSNNIDDLEKLSALKDKGIITDQEFEAKKKQILGL